MGNQTERRLVLPYVTSSVLPDGATIHDGVMPKWRPSHGIPWGGAHFRTSHEIYRVLKGKVLFRFDKETAVLTGPNAQSLFIERGTPYVLLLGPRARYISFAYKGDPSTYFDGQRRPRSGRHLVPDDDTRNSDDWYSDPVLDAVVRTIPAGDIMVQLGMVYDIEYPR